MIRRVIGAGRLLPLLSLLVFVSSIPVWLNGGAWVIPMLTAVYLVLLQTALERTGW